MAAEEYADRRPLVRLASEKRAYLFKLEKSPPVDMSEEMFPDPEDRPTSYRVSQDDPFTFVPRGKGERATKSPHVKLVFSADELDEILDRPAEEIERAVSAGEHDDDLEALEYAEANGDGREAVIDALLDRRVRIEERQERRQEIKSRKQSLRRYS